MDVSLAVTDRPNLPSGKPNDRIEVKWRSITHGFTEYKTDKLKKRELRNLIEAGLDLKTYSGKLFCHLHMKLKIKLELFRYGLHLDEIVLDDLIFVTPYHNVKYLIFHGLDPYKKKFNPHGRNIHCEIAKKLWPLSNHMNELTYFGFCHNSELKIIYDLAMEIKNSVNKAKSLIYDGKYLDAYSEFTTAAELVEKYAMIKTINDDISEEIFQIYSKAYGEHMIYLYQKAIEAAGLEIIQDRECRFKIFASHCLIYEIEKKFDTRSENTVDDLIKLFDDLIGRETSYTDRLELAMKLMSNFLSEEHKYQINQENDLKAKILLSKSASYVGYAAVLCEKQGLKDLADTYNKYVESVVEKLSQIKN